MTREEINKLFLKEKCPQNCRLRELIETHISWIILCGCFVYKIKKPVHYSFLDFSTLAKRKYYCEREIELNRRFADDLYLDVQPVKKTTCGFVIGEEEGAIVDYAVRMRKMDRQKQMDNLLVNNKVAPSDIQKLAEKIAAFHQNTEIIYQKDLLDIQKKFMDLEKEKNYLRQYLNCHSTDIINRAVDTSDVFIRNNAGLLAHRLNEGFFRDGHGDLHSRNIFLLPAPQPFDCIEFNDDYRQIDVLNEVAFLCMDLDAFGRHDLSDLFFTRYNNQFPTVKTKEECRLFVYYKSYRSNIRAKVNSLRARSATDDAQRMLALKEADKYLNLMNSYIKILKSESQKANCF
jgi:aminoglycoside phosphotransferase family enzyme